MPWYGWLIAAAGTGMILGWWLVQRFKKAEADALENAGLKARQKHEDAVRRVERTVGAEMAKVKAKLGPVTIKDWQFCLAFLLLPFVLGCGTEYRQHYGAQRMPRIELPERLSYSDEDKAALTKFSTEYPDLARKIVNQQQTLRAGLEAYEHEAWQHNTEMLRELGYSEEHILAIEGPDPRIPPKVESVEKSVESEEHKRWKESYSPEADGPEPPMEKPSRDEK